MNSDKIFEEKLKKIQNLEFEPSQIADIQKALDHTADASKKVDNIDVTGCEFVEKIGGEFWCNCYKVRMCELSRCKDNPNCYYREMAKSDMKNIDLRHEAEKLKNDLLVKDEVISRITTQLQQKERECDSLNARLKFKSEYDRANERKIFSLKKENKTLKQEFHKYRTELKAKDAEIEELKELFDKLAGKTIYVQNDTSIPKIFETFKDRQIQELESKLNKAIEGLEEISKMKKFDYDSEYTINLATQTLEEIKGKETSGGIKNVD